MKKNLRNHNSSAGSGVSTPPAATTTNPSTDRSTPSNVSPDPASLLPARCNLVGDVDSSPVFSGQVQAGPDACRAVECDTFELGAVKGFMASESETLKKGRLYPLSQRYYEYLMYSSSFPKLIPSDRVKLKAKVEEILGFKDFKNIQISELKLSKCSGSPILDSYAIDHGFSLR